METKKRQDSQFTTINDLLSPEMHVEPLKEGETATFRLMRAGRFDQQTQMLVKPAGHQIPGIEIIQDKFAGRPVRIINLKEFKAVPVPGGGQIYEPQHESVNFPSSATITCTADTNNLYLFLMRSSYNRDNKFRSTKYQPIFFQVDADRDASVSVDNTEYKRLALNIVADCNEKELIAIAYALNEADEIGIKIDMNLKSAKLRKAMNDIAESHSEKLILASDSDESKMRIWVDKATAQVVILFDNHEKKRQWVWVRNDDDKKKKVIVKIGEGNDPVKGLIDYLLIDEGSEHKAELVTRVAKEETYASA